MIGLANRIAVAASFTYTRHSLPSLPPKAANHWSFAHAGDFAQSPIKQKSKGHNCPMLSVILFFALL